MLSFQVKDFDHSIRLLNFDIVGGKNTGLPHLPFEKFTDYQKALILGLEDKIEA